MRILLIAMLLLVVCGVATEAAENEPWDVVRATLPNGLEVWIKPRSSTDVVDLRVVVKTGFRYESLRDSGISHLLEHMLFKGTTTRSEIELDRMLDRHGAYSNGQTWPGYTYYQVNIIASEIDQAFEWMTDLIRNPLLDPAHLDQAREDVYSEQRGDYPTFVEAIFRRGYFQPIELRVADALFPHAEIPSRAIVELDHVESDDLRRWYERFYVPNNMAVIVVGNVEPDEVLQRIETSLGDMRPQPVDSPEYVEWREPRERGTIVTRFMPPVGQMTELWDGVVTRGESDPDRIELMVIATWLDRRVREEVRSRRALAYRLGARLYGIEDAGVLYTYVDGRRGSDTEAEIGAIVDSLYDRLRAMPLPSDEIEEARSTIRGRLARAYENNSYLGGVYLQQFVLGRDADDLRRDSERLSVATSGDVLRVARARLSPERRFDAVARPTLSYAGVVVAIGSAISGAFLFALIVRWRRGRRSGDPS